MEQEKKERLRKASVVEALGEERKARGSGSGELVFLQQAVETGTGQTGDAHGLR
jgi:hypothetical protein